MSIEDPRGGCCFLLVLVLVAAACAVIVLAPEWITAALGPNFVHDIIGGW